MNKKILELQAKLAALEKAQDARFAKLDNEGIDLVALQQEIENGNKDIAAAKAEIEAAQKLQADIEARAARTRAGATVENNAAKRPWRGLGEMMAAVHAHAVTGVMDERLAQSSGIGSEGGFGIGTDMSNELIQQAFTQGQVTSRCRSIPISAASNAVELPAVDDKNRANGSRYGGVRVYWTAESGTIQQTSLAQMQKVHIGLQKLAALVTVPDELLADSTALEAYVNFAVPEEMQFVIQDAVLRGTGAGQPLGILNAASLVTQAAEGSQTAATINAANITKMYSRMPAQFKGSAAWFINSECFPQLQLMTSAATSASQMVYMPPQGLAEAPFGTLFGRPIFEIEQCSALGTVGDIIFADFSRYYLAQKGGVQRDVSLHLYFDKDQAAFRFLMRIDGKPSWTSPITPYKGTNSQSPFVVLAAR